VTGDGVGGVPLHKPVVTTRGDTQPVPLPQNELKLPSSLSHLNMIYIQKVTHVNIFAPFVRS